MRGYLLVMAVAAVVTFLAVPTVRVFARRANALTPLRDRDVHSVPTPRLGGVAMLGGFAAAMLIASEMDFLEGVFSGSRQAWAILAAAALVCLLGVADDIWDLDWMTKLVGQVLAAGLMAWQGVQLVTVPLGPTLTIGSPRMSLIVTVLVVVVAINAVNFVDGLDGLAAGMVAIGGAAFFLYGYFLTRSQSPGDFSDLATLIMAALVGACLGFLPHNFNPATIFMGDSGAMVLGLLVAAAGIVVTGNVDPSQVGTGDQALAALPAFLPLALPFAVMLVPLFDFAFAVVRRIGSGHSPFKADGAHLHHRLLRLGHSHRRAVVIMYAWTAVFAFGTVALAVWAWPAVLAGIVIAAAGIIVVTMRPRRAGGEPPRAGADRGEQAPVRESTP